MFFLWSLFSFIVAITILVGVHEFGHFWAARKCGILVERFSIGFGKVIWRKKDKKGTEFVISAIPLGGYVKMLGMQKEKISPELQSMAFTHKPIRQRAFVILAGPVANFIFAIIAYILIYLIGMPTLKPVIGNVEPNSRAAVANLQPNMKIVSIDDTKTNDWETINMLLATKIGNPQLKLEVSEFNADREFSSPNVYKYLNLSDWKYDPDKESILTGLGISPMRGEIQPIISMVSRNSPAEKAGLLVQDKILSINDQQLAWQQIVGLILNSAGKPLFLEIERDNQIIHINIIPELDSHNQSYLGIAPTILPLDKQYRNDLQYGIFESILKSIEKTAQLSWITVKFIGKLFTGDLSLKSLSGPISIAKGAGITSEIGFVYYLSFLALISVNLGIMNLFPLPVLDGGHLVFLTIEKIIGHPISEKTQELFYRIGAILLLILTIFALFNDVVRL